jgi:flagellar basal body-associated protein FliL
MSFFLLFSQDLKLKKDKPKIRLKKKNLIIILIVVVVVLLILIAAAIGWAIYRWCQKTDKKKYDPCATNELPVSIELSKVNIKKDPSQQPTVGPYPERHADI